MVGGGISPGVAGPQAWQLTSTGPAVVDERPQRVEAEAALERRGRPFRRPRSVYASRSADPRPTSPTKSAQPVHPGQMGCTPQHSPTATGLLYNPRTQLTGFR